MSDSPQPGAQAPAAPDAAAEGAERPAPPRWFDPQGLREAAAALFRAAGAPPTEAAEVARLLVLANLGGHDSHGVVRIPQYLRNIRRGRLQPGAACTVTVDNGAAVRLSANWGFGQTGTLEAVRLGIERARTRNAVAVGVSELNHNGRLADYLPPLLEAGMIGLLFAASSGFNALVAPFGGSERRLNTNPFAAGFPSAGAAPLAFDIATSASSQGRMKVLVDSGLAAPPGVLIDAQGHPSTDPRDLYRGGAILPFGEAQGYKGYLLNVLVEVLGGILTDGGFMGQPKREAGGQCLLLIALNVAAFRDLPLFHAELERLIAYLKATRPLPGQEILAPGEASARRLHERSRTGIALPAATVQDLQAELTHYGLPTDLAAEGHDQPLG